MQEPWSTRWYTPLVVLGAGLITLLVVALAGVEVLTAAVPRAAAPRAWTTPLGRINEAFDAGDSAAALSWWREARAAAVRSGQWEGMIEVGDAARRFAGGGPRARQAYLTALFRARQQRSLDGVLSAAIGFGELGDRDALVQALRMAARTAGSDPRAQARVKVIADRWLLWPLTTDRHDVSVPGDHQP